MTVPPGARLESDVDPADERPVGTVVHLTAEYWPYARTGGLAEAVRGIATHQAAAGRKTMVFMPLYGRVRSRFNAEPLGKPYEVALGARRLSACLHHDPATASDDAHVVFVGNEELFGRPEIYGEQGDYPDNHLRFGFFCRAVLQALPKVAPGAVIIHPHDWHTALAPTYLRTTLAGDPYYDALASVLTVHNAGYQGHFGRDVLGELGLDHRIGWELTEWYGRVNLLKGGLECSEIVTTVSPTHARELRTAVGGFGLHDTFNDLFHRFVGILNGIDYAVWDPATDMYLERTFDADDLAGKAACKDALQKELGIACETDRPLFGMTARLVEQKGFDILLQSNVIAQPHAQWAFLGEGEARYRDALSALAKQWPDRVAACFEFTEEREHRLLAGADFLLMPSLYEPCGLTQMRAQRYGALPLVRRVGGLADTVEDRITGFVFDEYQPWALAEAVRYAIALYGDRESWEERAKDAMSRDFGWSRSVGRYRELYERALKIRRLGTG
jgi:starch synthase